MDRIDALEQEHRDLMTGFRVNHAMGSGRELEKEQQKYFAKLRVTEKDQGGMPRDVMLTFPGFPNYKGPVS